MNDHRVCVMAESGSISLTHEEYDFLLVEEYLHRLGSGESLEGFVCRLDRLHGEITEDLAEGAFHDQDEELVKGILKKLGEPRAVWLFVE